MRKNQKMMPIGIENFAEIRQGSYTPSRSSSSRGGYLNGYYYVDKTGLIAELFEDLAKVTLFTRPRRFGKTLNMSMLRYFFEIGTEGALFDDLKIAENKALCEAYMGKYPVIFVSLKGVDGLSFSDAERMLRTIVKRETRRHDYLRDSERLSAEEQKELQKMLRGEYENLADSLLLLSQLLYRHYGQKTVILIDEYDVPLDKAFANGYYREMVALIRGFLGQALKTNEFLQLAVLTGCLRISKESIFTGLNNFKVHSITDARFGEYFGFTDGEVWEMLSYYGLSERYAVLKEWYDGYRFGEEDIYCPWDVINYVSLLRADPKARPQAFWINTSGNALVKRFIDKADKTTKGEIESLIAGDSIEKTLRLDLTYDELDASIDNVWSVLFTTGYLTMAEETDLNTYKLIIPNREVREVFVWQIREWFRETVMRDDTPMRPLCQAFQVGDAAKVQKQLDRILARSISILDARAREGQKENFYHGLLIGLLQYESEWGVFSNTEAGEGFSDIIVELEDPDEGIVIEVKYAASFAGLERACERAMAQIKERDYGARLREEGRVDILAYGIAFHKKRCRVVAERI